MVPVAVAAAFLYSNFLIDWVLRGFHGLDIVVSLLASPGQPNAAVLRVTDVVCAVLVLLLLPAFFAALPPGPTRKVVAWTMVAFALGVVAAVIVPAPCGPEHLCASTSDRLDEPIHDAASILSEVSLFVSAAATWFAMRSTGPNWFRRAAWGTFWVGGVALNLLFGWYLEVSDSPTAEGLAGYVQRLHILSVSAWILCIGIHASRAAPLCAEEEPW
ncbi:DUF998 domain-containing protein [Occultella aeris]|uniref:DUF998 domain-containing protein n=1 Tax=Occultella aeris TaxID=2761496 RepID=UPI0018D41F0B|nr:DUF998 domain-containing protein [Occultella aeris]